MQAEIAFLLGQHHSPTTHRPPGPCLTRFCLRVVAKKSNIDKPTVRLHFGNAVRSPCLQAASATSLVTIVSDDDPSAGWALLKLYIILLAIVVCILLAIIAYLSLRTWTTQTKKRALEQMVEKLKRDLAQKTRELEAAESELQRIRPEVQTLEREVQEGQEGMMIVLVEARATGVVASPERPERQDTRHLRALMVLTRVYTTGGRSGRKFHEEQCHFIRKAESPQEMTWADAVNRGLPLCTRCETRIKERAMAQGLRASA